MGPHMIINIHTILLKIRNSRPKYFHSRGVTAKNIIHESIHLHITNTHKRSQLLNRLISLHEPHGMRLLFRVAAKLDLGGKVLRG